MGGIRIFTTSSVKAASPDKKVSIPRVKSMGPSGALFVHAKADGVTPSDIKHSLYVPHHVRSFFLLNGAQNYEGTSRPLLAVQATELADGIFIGCTMNHTVADGTSFWHFFNSWSEISRGSDFVSKAPLLERSFLDGTISTPIRIPIFPNTPGRDQVFDDKVIDKINIPAASSYRLIIGTRSRLNPPLPQQYFGNALQAGTVTKKAGDVLERGTGSVAWEMNKMVALHTEEKVRSFLECWVREPELMTVDNLTGKALVTSSSPRFDVYGNEFGWGRPVGVRTGAGNKSHGKISVFAGDEEGSIDVEACLLAETLGPSGMIRNSWMRSQ
ncbi:hypothetical protein C1H46_036007 [Malus baccata]|uniref:Acetyltransferase n=1 Tax=Malus baccata TaxID=106549 RepID=A0A540KW29_MALBA|nr:hypothetical protein C1H46_036007 [Malus baccata]